MWKFIFAITFVVCDAVSSNHQDIFMIQKETFSIPIFQTRHKVVQVPTKNVFGDSPFWDAETNSLYYVDVFNNVFDVYRYDYNENKFYAAKVLGESNVGFIIPLKGCIGQFAIGGLNRTVKIISWDGKSDKAIVLYDAFAIEQNPFYSTNHLHIAKIDPKGRFYGGTYRSVICGPMQTANGSLYRYTQCDGLKRVPVSIKISNDFDWDVKAKKFYQVDACKFGIREYEWEPKSGKICTVNTIKSNQKVSMGNNMSLAFSQVTDEESINNYCNSFGAPLVTGIGITVDCAGNLFAGIYNGSAVHKIDPRHDYKLKSIFHRFPR